MIEIDRSRTWDFKVDSCSIKLISDAGHPLKINPRVIITYGSGQSFNTTLEELRLAVETMGNIQREEQ